jgi:hypothetical protein
MKELPYFKFYPSEYIHGDIYFMPVQAQGIFTNFCCIAWFKGGYVEENETMKKRLNINSTNDEEMFNRLITAGIIKRNEKGLYVEFLLEQLEEYIEKSNKNSAAGKKSAESKCLKKRLITKLNANSTQIQQPINASSTNVERTLNASSTESQRNSTILKGEGALKGDVKGEHANCSEPKGLLDSKPTTISNSSNKTLTLKDGNWAMSDERPMDAKAPSIRISQTNEAGACLADDNQMLSRCLANDKQLIAKTNLGGGEGEGEGVVGPKDAIASSSTKVFIKPFIKEIQNYASEMKFERFNADRFFDFYECKGWMVGKNKMKDWKAAVRNWAKGDSNKPQSNKTNGLAIGQVHHQEGYTWPERK